MTCANILLTILSAIILLTIFLPIFSAGATKWIIVIAATLIIIIAWTMVDCKPCGMLKKK